MYTAITKIAECLSKAMTKTAFGVGTGAAIGAIGNVGLAALHNRRAGETDASGNPIKRRSYVGAAFGGGIAGGAAGYGAKKFMGTKTGKAFGKSWDRQVKSWTSGPTKTKTAPAAPAVPPAAPVP